MANNFVFDYILKEGIKFLPAWIEKLSDKLPEGTSIMVVPAKSKVFVCIGKFETRILEVSEASPNDTKLSVNPEVDCKQFMLPDELDALTDYFDNLNK